MRIALTLALDITRHQPDNTHTDMPARDAAHLDNLPDRSVVLDHRGIAWQRRDNEWRSHDGFATSARLISAGPVTIVHTHKEAA